MNEGGKQEMAKLLPLRVYSFTLVISPEIIHVKFGENVFYGTILEMTQ